MRKTRCIFLKLQHGALDSIQIFRKRHDPLFLKVPPHVTLVHPFNSTLEPGEVVFHVKNNFDLSAKGFTHGRPIWKDGLVSLPLTKCAELTQVRERLYFGRYREFYKPGYPYMPHITLGRYANESEASEQQEFSGNLNFGKDGLFSSLVVEVILEDEASFVEFEMLL